MNVVGITSGIGSLQYGFKGQGFKIGPAHEWRKYYNIAGTFTRNYGSVLSEEYDLDSKWKHPVCIVSHPECGNYSNLYTGSNRGQREQDPGDIYKFIDLCKIYKPQTFLCDNLPKSLLAVSKTEWRKKFRDYKISFEYVSNWGYGNVQKNRNRFFVIGVHKDLDWVFRPQERKHNTLLTDVIFDLSDKIPNHIEMQLSDYTQWRGYQIGNIKKDRLKLKDLQNWLGSCRLNANMPYYNKAGDLKSKPGYSVINPEKHAPVLSGGGGVYDNHWIYNGHYYRPLTIRERLRIQGFGDEFICYPLEFEFGTKEHLSLIKQTGKCMPVQFPTEFARQLKNYLLNGVQEENESRLLKRL